MESSGYGGRCKSDGDECCKGVEKNVQRVPLRVRRFGIMKTCFVEMWVEKIAA